VKLEPESWTELPLQLNPERQELRFLLAHFENRDIWYELLKSSHHSSNIPDWLEKTISSELAFKIGERTLIRFSLLEIKNKKEAMLCTQWYKSGVFTLPAETKLWFRPS
jgi:hypothetical protein